MNAVSRDLVRAGPGRAEEFRIGIDLGGTKTEIAALDRGGGIAFRRRVASPRHDYPATIETIGGLVAAAEAELGTQASVGIGVPGSLSPATGLARNGNSTWLNGRPLQQDIEARLGRPIRLANDANCFTLSEAIDGAAAGARIVFGVILGTGVGGGVVVDGRALDGANGIAGEWGHTPLAATPDDPLSPRPCWCGRVNCLETFLCGPALEAEFRMAGGESLSCDRIALRAAGGDAAAQAVYGRYLARLARALAGIVNVLDPDVIVLGGGVSNIPDLGARIAERWGPHVFSDRIVTRIVRAAHGDSSGVRGAARLWSDVET